MLKSVSSSLSHSIVIVKLRCFQIVKKPLEEPLIWALAFSSCIYDSYYKRPLGAGVISVGLCHGPDVTLHKRVFKSVNDYFKAAVRTEWQLNGGAWARAHPYEP